MLHATYPGLTQERAAYGFRYGGDPGDECGPSGLVFASSGEWLVANGGTGELFRLWDFGLPVGEPIDAEAGLLDLGVGRDGELYGSRLQEIVELDTATGQAWRSITGGFSELAGLAVDPRSGALLVADFGASALYEVAPESGERRPRASGEALGNPDGIVVDGAGRVYVAAYRSKHVLAVDDDGGITDLGTLEGGPDGIALGGEDGPFSGSLIVNQRDGQVVALRPGDAVTTLAVGGTPGDLIAVDAEGYLYVTQFEEIVRFGPAWFAPQPWRQLPTTPVS